MSCEGSASACIVRLADCMPPFIFFNPFNFFLTFLTATTISNDHDLEKLSAATLADPFILMR